MNLLEYGRNEFLAIAAVAAKEAGLDLEVADNTVDLQGIIYGAKPGLALQAPDVEFITHYERELTWRLVLAAPQQLDHAAAWALLSDLIDVLAPEDVLDVDKAVTSQFQPQTGDPVPAYLLHITTRQII